MFAYYNVLCKPGMTSKYIPRQFIAFSQKGKDLEKFYAFFFTFP